MTILYTSNQVQREIRRLFAISKGRRVVVSAFVGSEAHAYLPKPAEIELLCWPKAGGTNPHAIRDLMSRGVKVFFADAVHMKLYWTSDKGAVLTSANLSTNALGGGGLKEIGVFLPKGKVEIDRVIKSLSARAVSDDDLLKLDQEHKAYFKKNPLPQSAKTSHLLSFDKWYHSMGRSPWKIAWYQFDNFKLAEESKKVLEREHGSVSYEFILDSPENFCREDDWLLCFNIDNKNIGRPEWVFAHHVVKTSSVKKPSRSHGDYQILQVNKLQTYLPPPFQLDNEFKATFVKAVRSFGGVEKLEELRNADPPESLVDLIYQYYTAKR